MAEDKAAREKAEGESAKAKEEKIAAGGALKFVEDEEKKAAELAKKYP